MDRMVILCEKEGNDILEFELKKGNKEININSEDQNGLRSLFYSIISEAMEEEFSYSLNVQEGYEKQLYIEIATEYLNQLNTELNEIRKIADDDPYFSDTE